MHGNALKEAHSKKVPLLAICPENDGSKTMEYKETGEMVIRILWFTKKTPNPVAGIQSGEHTIFQQNPDDRERSLENSFFLRK